MTGSVWSCLTLMGARQQFAGNEGYPDVLGEYYCCDSLVPNARHIAVGDVLVLRDRRHILGAGRVQHITSWAVDKPVFKCPHCHWGKIRKRAGTPASYRCERCKEQFSEPERTTKRAVEFRIFYGDTWQPAPRETSAALLEPFYKRRARQHAIRELQGMRALEALDVTSVPDVAGPSEIPGGFREAVVRARVNQGPFRMAMLSRFRGQCAITGPCHPAALEAAHLDKFARSGRHQVDGGLLLRRDLHALFDNHLLSIDPQTWKVRISPALQIYPDVQRYEGTVLQIGEAVRPRTDLVDEHYRQALEIWASESH